MQHLSHFATGTPSSVVVLLIFHYVYTESSGDSYISWQGGFLFLLSKHFTCTDNVYNILHFHAVYIPFVTFYVDEQISWLSWSLKHSGQVITDRYNYSTSPVFFVQILTDALSEESWMTASLLRSPSRSLYGLCGLDSPNDLQVIHYPFHVPVDRLQRTNYNWHPWYFNIP